MKVLVLVIVIAVVAGLLFIVFNRQVTTGPVTEAQAEQLVLSDVNATNPGALVTIINASPSTLESGSWNIVLSVVYNATRACPTLSIEDFDYPATGLSGATINNYTSNCIIYGISSAPSYVISSPYIAIARSYNSTIAKNYVTTYGYSNTQVHARFYSSLNSTSTPLNQTLASVWIINYSATPASFNQYFVLSLSGAVLGNYTAQK